MSSSKHISSTTAILYRILLQEVRASQHHLKPILQRTLDPREYGQAYTFDLPVKSSIVKNGDEVCSKAKGNDILKFLTSTARISNNVEEENSSALLGPESSVMDISQASLEAAVKNGFRDSESTNIVKSHERAITAIRELQIQMELWKRTSIHVDEARNIVCMVTSSCIGRRSNGQYDSPFFAYRVRIENRNDPSISDTTVQLLGREWKIYDDEKNIINFVDFPNAGAVGHHPVLHPGQGFEYMSGTELSSKHGSMEGRFTMAEVERGTAPGRVGDELDAFCLEEDALFDLKVETVPLISD